METEKLPCKPLEIVNARRWFADALLGLQYLHYEGIVHHDLKPDNILVSAQGDAVIADFGVARAGGGTSNGQASVMGTPLYNAPEKFATQPPRGIDATKADVWALGATLHAFVFGDVPYPAAQHETAEKLAAAVTAPAPWVSPMPLADPTLIALVSSMLAKSSEERSTLTQVREAPWLAAEHLDDGSAHKGCDVSEWQRIEVSRHKWRKSVHKGTSVDLLDLLDVDMRRGGCWPCMGETAQRTHETVVVVEGKV